jgi:acetyl-CoA carboxylase biotin carboxyl carrier protein
MNLKEIKEIIGLMNENDLTEIEVEREGSKIKIKRASTEFVETLVRPSPGLPQYRVETQPAGQPAAPKPPAAENNGKPTKNISSPMVGTFYRSPSPESPSFVDIGQVVEVGQVVCIVEAMKLMNEIKSEVRGKIIDVKANNAEPVEFGQPLFVVEPL